MLCLSVSVVAFVLFSFVHAQKVVTITQLANLSTGLSANTIYDLTILIPIRTSINIDVVGLNDTFIRCAQLPCFEIDADTNVSFTDVSFLLPSLISPGQVLFRVNKVRQLTLSGLSFRANESQQVSLVEWSNAARGDLTIRRLGSQSAPLPFQSVLSSSATSHVNALVVEDAYGSCSSDSVHCFVLNSVSGATQGPTVSFSNVHWRQNGTAQILVPFQGSGGAPFRSLTLSRSTFFVA
jgi:hypothetical protein